MRVELEGAGFAKPASAVNADQSWAFRGCSSGCTWHADREQLIDRDTPQRWAGAVANWWAAAQGELWHGAALRPRILATGPQRKAGCALHSLWAICHCPSATCHWLQVSERKILMRF